MIDRLGVGRLVAEDDGEATVQVSLGLEALGDDLRVEADLGEDLGIGPEGDRRAAAARRAELLERARRLAARARLLPLEAVALDARRALLGERVHHRGADAVQPARAVVVLRVELAARVEPGARRPD